MKNTCKARVFASIVFALPALPLAAAPASVADHPDGEPPIDQTRWIPAARLDAPRLLGYLPGPVASTPEGAPARRVIASRVSLCRVASTPEGAPAPDAFFVFTGSNPEGDAPSDVAYTPDGSWIVIAHRESRNLIIWDADTLDFVASIPLSGAPQALAITPDGSTAVVANIDADTVSIVDLDALTETAVVPVGAAPGQVAISPAGDLAAVGVGFESELAVIDIAGASVARTISGIGYAVRISFSIEAPGTSIQYSNFAFIDDDRVINADLGADEMQIVDVRTGSVARTPIADSAAGLAVSGDRSTAVITHSFSARALDIIDTATGTITSTIVPGFDLTGPVTLNTDGSIGVVAIQNASRVLDLTSGSFGPSIDTASINDYLTTFDGRYAVGVGFRGPVIDMLTGAYAAEVNNAVSTEIGALSPTDYQAAMCSTTFGDDLVVADVHGAMGGLISYQLSGPEPEGDRCRTIAITPDGATAVGVSIFSDTATITDTATGTVTGYAPLGERPSAIAITPDGSTAVVGNLDSDFASIVDLATATSTQVPISTRAGAVAVSPDGHYAYVAVLASGDGVWRIDLTTNTVAGPRIPTGNMGGVGYSFSQTSGIALSNDASLLAVAGSFDNAITFIDTATWTALGNVAAGDFPTMVSFAPDDSFIYASNRNGDTISVYTNPGSGLPTLLGSFPVGDSPWQTADDGHGRLWVNNSGDNRVTAYDRATGSALGSVGFNDPVVGLSYDPATNSVRVAHGTVNITLGGEVGFSQSQSGTLTVIDADTFATTDYDLGVGPSALASSADGQTLAVAAPIGDGMAILNLAQSCSGADLAEPYGQLDFFDVSAFLTAFNAQDPSADFDANGVFNFFDASMFITTFSAGCP